jgi:hypothetical protein
MAEAYLAVVEINDVVRQGKIFLQLFFLPQIFAKGGDDGLCKSVGHMLEA